ncbi:hypothetical protein TNCV_1226681 [Trichonephila clavipes]|nr:hypothetical protein TNCV_1226681 [Trichonephila clavipes]
MIVLSVLSSAAPAVYDSGIARSIPGLTFIRFHLQSLKSGCPRMPAQVSSTSLDHGPKITCSVAKSPRVPEQCDVIIQSIQTPNAMYKLGGGCRENPRGAIITQERKRNPNEIKRHKDTSPEGVRISCHWHIYTNDTNEICIGRLRSENARCFHGSVAAVMDIHATRSISE